MTKLSDLKIGTQLKIGFGVIILLILTLGAISWQQSDRLAKTASDIFEHPLKVRRALSDLKIDVLSIRLEFLNILLSENEGNRLKALTNTTLNQADAEQNFDVLESQYLGPKADIQEAHQAFLQWITILEEFRDLVRSGKTNDELIRFNRAVDMAKANTKVVESIKTIDLYSYGKADELHNNSIQLKKSINLQLSLLIASILLLSLLVISMLIYNVHKPVTELIKVTRQFGKGRFSVRSSYTSLNEFGVLSNSFNHLAKTIEDQFKVKDLSARLNAIMLKCLESNSSLLQVLEPMIKLTGSHVGAIYLLNEQKTHFEHLESIGLEATAHRNFSALDFEGEFGTVLITKKIEHITKISEDTQLSFKAVSGALRPKEILTIPLIQNENVLAIISLSSLKAYDSPEIQLIKDIYGPLTTWMNAMIANRKIQKMGENLKQQNIELEAQKKELAAQSGELLEQNTELEMQKKQLHDSNQLKSSFLSNMSHELRTPLNSVIALCGVLNRRLVNKIGAEEYSYLGVIERNGKQLLELINDILDISRIEAGYEEVKISCFNVNILLRDVTDLIEPQARHKNINLRLVTDEKLPPLKSDYEKCRHILQNIVANAIKFTEKGEVTVGVNTDKQTVFIEVTDTGIGIDKEFITHIFDEFRQADSSNSRKYGGTGLGLSIAKKYVTMLGGQIEVESQLGKGSKFTVQLPLESNLTTQVTEHHFAPPVHPPLQILTEISDRERAEKTILLVEDSEAIRIQMCDILISQGYMVEVAQNGSEALEQIANKMPDALILDLMMPEVDGFEVLRRIRDKEETSHLPVVILTAKYITKEDLTFLKHNNVHQLIQKGDINKSQLLEIVSKMLFPEKTIPVPLAIPKDKKQVVDFPRILVVEDNPDNMVTIKALLNGIAEILEATDGKQGLELALQHLPDLVLMDIALPDSNGNEVLQRMKMEKSLQHIPVIAVTASAMKGNREQFIADGFDDYIAKPIDHAVFEKIIKEALGYNNPKS